MGSPKNVTQTTKSEPWSGAKPFYKDLYGRATEALNATNKQQYTGDLWASPTDTQVGANQQLKDLSGSWMNTAGGWGQGASGLRDFGGQLLGNAYDEKWLNPESNPWLKANVDAGIGAATRNFERNVLPGMGDAAIKGGAYGGSRQGIMEGLAAGEFGRETGDIATKIYGENFQKERDRMLQSQGLAAQFAPGMYSGANALENQAIQGQKFANEQLMGAGTQEQQWNQMQNQENLDRYKMAQSSVWAGIPEMLSVLTGGNFQSSAQTGPNPNYMNPMQTAMGAGSMIAGLADAFNWGNKPA